MKILIHLTVYRYTPISSAGRIDTQIENSNREGGYLGNRATVASMEKTDVKRL